MMIATLFLVLNPAVIAIILLGYRGESSNRAESRIAALAGVVAFAIISAVAVIGETLLGALDISDATFLIAAGILVIFGAFQAFLRLGVGYRLEEKIWFIVALVMWLVSPAALAAAIAIRLEWGVVVAVVGSAIAVAAAISTGLVWPLFLENRHVLILGWVRRALAALAAVGGVDLIRQGVLSI